MSVKKIVIKIFFLGLAFLGLFGFFSTVSAGQLNLGTEFLGWSTNYSAPVNGLEFWVPLSANFSLDKSFSLYGQTEFGSGSYTSTSMNSPTVTTNLTNVSDTVIGGELDFKSFSLPAILNIGLNLPTGDPIWESKQISGNIPTEFIDSRYRGRGFGISALYGLSFPSGGGEFGAAVGYMYAGAFNPSYGSLPAGQLKLGDSIFLSLNHVQPYSGGQEEIVRLSIFNSLPTQNNGQGIYQLGTNLNASYSWINPKAFSLELGGQYWFPGQVPGPYGNLMAETNAFYGPRFYLDPSYTFGDFSVSSRLKFILTNGYPASTLSTPDPYYDGGGFLAGIEPSYNFKLDSVSNLKLKVSFDDIILVNVLGSDGTSDANANYALWTFGATYEVKL